MLTVRYRFIPETKPHHITTFSRLIDLSKTYKIYNWDSVCSYTLLLHVTTLCLRVGVSSYTVQTTVCVHIQFFFLLALQPPLGVVFYSPLVGFSLLACEVS